MAAPHPTLLSLVRGEPFPSDFTVTKLVIRSAVEHGVAPLLDDATRRLGLAGDKDALTQLAVQGLKSAADTNAANSALDALLDQAESLGMDIAVFKGQAIGKRWYPRPDLRPSYDVDIFVNPHHLDRLGGLVASLDGNPRSRTAIDRMVVEGRVFEHTVSVGGVAVDVHRDPMNLVLPTRRQDLMWQRTVLLDLGDERSVRTLDLELSMVQALLHAFRDNFADLLHLYDIELMGAADPDWNFIAAFAEAEGWTDIIRFSLGFVCDVFEHPSPLPRDLSPGSRALIRMLWPSRILLQGVDSVVRSHHRQSAVSLLITGRRPDLANVMLRRIFPPRSVIDFRFPNSGGSYLFALARWRRAQRGWIRRLGATAVDGEAPADDNASYPGITGN